MKATKVFQQRHAPASSDHCPGLTHKNMGKRKLEQSKEKLSRHDRSNESSKATG